MSCTSRGLSRNTSRAMTSNARTLVCLITTFVDSSYKHGRPWHAIYLFIYFGVLSPNHTGQRRERIMHSIQNIKCVHTFYNIKHVASLHCLRGKKIILQYKFTLWKLPVASPTDSRCRGKVRKFQLTSYSIIDSGLCPANPIPTKILNAFVSRTKIHHFQNLFQWAAHFHLSNCLIFQTLVVCKLNYTKLRTKLS